jgi:AAA+ superfamily predicted ATPase
MQFHNVYTLSRLRDEFGPIVAVEGSITRTVHDLIGDDYRRMLAEQTEIVTHQWRNEIRRSAVKGFLLSGPPGVGKTTLARRVALELCQRFPASSGAEDESQVAMALIDGGEIARARYGESEERIREVFSRARSGFTESSPRSIILLDDVESILMARGSDNAKEWHFSQDSVFFHAVDELDTSHVIVFLTSNRPDLVDAAIVDRFLGYGFRVPDSELLVSVAARRAEEQQLSTSQIRTLSERVRAAADAGQLKSIREAERMVVRQYIEDILGFASAAVIGSHEQENGRSTAGALQMS